MMSATNLIAQMPADYKNKVRFLQPVFENHIRIKSLAGAGDGHRVHHLLRFPLTTSGLARILSKGRYTALRSCRSARSTLRCLGAALRASVGRFQSPTSMQAGLVESTSRAIASSCTTPCGFPIPLARTTKARTGNMLSTSEQGRIERCNLGN